MRPGILYATSCFLNLDIFFWTSVTEVLQNDIVNALPIFLYKPENFTDGLSCSVSLSEFAAINGFAINVAMLIIGRIFLGLGVGFAYQSVPLYLSEMASPRLRGALNMCFQLFITIGIVAANLINYDTQKIKGGWGWRISLALVAVPAIIMTVGSLGHSRNPEMTPRRNGFAGDVSPGNIEMTSNNF